MSSVYPGSAELPQHRGSAGQNPQVKLIPEPTGESTGAA